VTHRRAGKTVACVHDLQRTALSCANVRPRFAYLAPFMKQAKAVAWDYLRAAMAPLREFGATAHESELRVASWHGQKDFPLRDHRIQLLVRDAILWHLAQAKANAAAAKPLPPVQRSSASPSRAAARQEMIDSLSKRLDVSGSLKDAAALVRARRTQ